MALIWALPPTRDTEMPGFTAGMHAGMEQLRLQIDLAVCDGDDVGGDIGGHIAGLRFDDGQRRQGAAAQSGRSGGRHAPDRRLWR